jgi:hypothetical protein
MELIMRNQTKRMNNEISNVNNRKMINNDLYKVLLAIVETYEKAYAKTVAVDDCEYDYDDDVISVERIFDEIIDFIYGDYAGNTRLMQKRIVELNRIRDHYTDEEHIKYKF